MKGLIQTATGDLVAAGFTVFDAEPGKTIRTDVPEPAQVRGQRYADNKMHNWNGAVWSLVAQPSGILERPGQVLISANSIDAFAGATRVVLLPLGVVSLRLPDAGGSGAFQLPVPKDWKSGGRLRVFYYPSINQPANTIEIEWRFTVKAVGEILAAPVDDEQLPAPESPGLINECGEFEMKDIDADALDKIGKDKLMIFRVLRKTDSFTGAVHITHCIFEYNY